MDEHSSLLIEKIEPLSWVEFLGVGIGQRGNIIGSEISHKEKQPTAIYSVANDKREISDSSQDDKEVQPSYFQSLLAQFIGYPRSAPKPDSPLIRTSKVVEVKKSGNKDVKSTHSHHYCNRQKQIRNASHGTGSNA